MIDAAKRAPAIRFRRMPARQRRAVASAIRRADVGAPRWSSTMRSSLALAREAQHRAQEILTARGIHPGCAKNQMLAAGFTQRVLAGQFAATINTERRGRIVLAIGTRALPIEHVIGGIVHDERTRLRRPRAQHGERPMIDAIGEVLLVLGTIDGRVRCGIHHDVRRYRVQRIAQSFRFGEIDADAALAVFKQAGTRRADQLTQGRKQTRQFEADLTIGAEQQDFHALPCAGSYLGNFSCGTSRRNGAR